MALVHAPVVWDMLSMAGPVHPSRPGIHPGFPHNRTLQPAGCESVLMQPVQLQSGEVEEEVVPLSDLHKAQNQDPFHNTQSRNIYILFTTDAVLIHRPQSCFVVAEPKGRTHSNHFQPWLCKVQQLISRDLILFNF